MRTPNVEMSWDQEKKCWLVRIQMGEEVIRRQCKVDRNTDESTLRSLAVQTTKDEGYSVDPGSVTVLA